MNLSVSKFQIILRKVREGGVSFWSLTDKGQGGSGPRSPERWVRWVHSPSQFEIFAAIFG